MGQSAGEEGGEVKLGATVILQVAGILIAMGVAWGMLTQKQNATDATNVQIMLKLDDIQERVIRLELNTAAGRRPATGPRER